MAGAANPVRLLDGGSGLPDAAIVDLQDGRWHNRALDGGYTAHSALGSPSPHDVWGRTEVSVDRLAHRILGIGALLRIGRAAHGRHPSPRQPRPAGLEPLQSDVQRREAYRLPA